MTDTAPPAPGANTNSPRAAEPRMGISAEMIIDAYEKAAPPATVEQRELILWLYGHAKAQKLAGNEAVGKLFTPPRDASTISKLFGGKYGAGLERICADIAELRALEVQRVLSAVEPIVVLPRLTETVRNFAELVHATRSMGFLHGPNQSGKSKTLTQYVARSKRHTVRVNMPEGGGRTAFLDRCLAAMKISDRKPNGDKSPTVLKYLTPDTELIVDEFHQCWVKGTLAVLTVEMIRLWREESGCSVLYVCTNLDALANKRFSAVLSQTGNRGVFRQEIPIAPHTDDVAAVLGGYRLNVPARGSAAAKIVNAICEESGLGKLSKHLLAGRLLAANRGQVYAWTHFVESVMTWDTALCFRLGLGNTEGGR